MSSDLLSLLDGTPCPDCLEGTLEASDYKGNDAAVCATCQTPAAQVW